MTFARSGLIPVLLLTMFATAAQAASNPLRIPELIDTRDMETLDLTMQSGQHAFYPGVKSDTKGFNGDFLGPAIRLHRGQDIQIRFHNQLDEDTTVHGHGLHVPGKVDGGPQQLIKPGKTWEANLQIRQQAGTSWFHPHRKGDTARQVHAGLAGIYLIEDENSKSLDLPKRYGVDDIPLVVQDRNFTDGKMDPYRLEGEAAENGYLGETLIANGTPDAYKEVPQGWVRLRLVNGANARTYRFYMEGDSPFYVIATEGGFLEEPVEVKELVMSSGERNEIMVNMADHKARKLMAEFLPIGGVDQGDDDEAWRDEEDDDWEDEDGGIFSRWGDDEWDGEDDGSDDPHAGTLATVVELRANPELTVQGTLPQKLNEIEFLQREDASNVREFHMNMEIPRRNRSGEDIFGINKKPMKMGQINERVKLGSTEIWTVSGDWMPHPFHIHGVSFQILSRNGEPPRPEERGWKDTVFVDNGETIELIMCFDYAASEEFPFMYHCHILSHEDLGMMGQFTVQ